MNIFQQMNILTNLMNGIVEFEQYEQNFKQKEFDYRTKCQNILSSEKLAVNENDIT